MPVHDLYCRGCDAEKRNVEASVDSMPTCCGAEMRVDWSHGKAPSTDVYGSRRWNEAVGDYVGSTREAETTMRLAGFEPAGDRVGGARNEDHMGLGKVYSYSEQTNRTPLTRRSA